MWKGTIKGGNNMIFNIIKISILIICLIFIGWFAISYIDVLVHNLSGGSDNSWNMFNMLLGG